MGQQWVQIVCEAGFESGYAFILGGCFDGASDEIQTETLATTTLDQATVFAGILQLQFVGQTRQLCFVKLAETSDAFKSVISGC